MRVAVCFSGQLRSFKFCWPSIYKTVIEPYQADLFLYVPEEQYTQQKLAVIGKYPHVKEIKIFKEVHIDEKCYENRRHIVPVQPILRSLVYHKESETMKTQYEEANGFKYDWVFRCRYDGLMEGKLEDLSQLDSGYIYVPERDHYIGVNDRFAFSSSDLMKVYQNRIDHMDDYFNHGGVVYNEGFLRACLERFGIKIRPTKVDVHLVRGENDVWKSSHQPWPVLTHTNIGKWTIFASSEGPWANKIYRDGQFYITEMKDGIVVKETKIEDKKILQALRAHPGGRLIEDWYLDCCKEKSDINEHLPLLYEYGKKSESIVELGVLFGKSTVALLNAKSKKLTSYDREITSVARAIESQAKRERISFDLIQADNLRIQIPKCDLLFIDTWGSYAQLKAELALHSGNVRKWIIMHDTEIFGEKDQNSEAVNVGLKRAIREFLAENVGWKKIYEVTNNNGLTILERG